MPEPPRIPAVKKVDENTVYCPRRNCKGEIVEILASRLSVLEENDQKQFGEQGARRNRCEENEAQSMSLLILREFVQGFGARRARIICDEQGRHCGLQDQGRQGVRARRIPTDRE